MLQRLRHRMLFDAFQLRHSLGSGKMTSFRGYSNESRDLQFQLILNMVDDKGPMTTQELWESVQREKSVGSKAGMKRILRELDRRKLLKARPDSDRRPGAPFRYHLIWNKFKRRDLLPGDEEDVTAAEPQQLEAPASPSNP